MKKLICIAFACLLLQSCGGGDPAPAPAPGDPQSASCTPEAQRASLMAWMDDRYLWYPQRAPADVGAQDLPAYFDSMLARPLDRYSFAQSTASFEQVFTTGLRYGYGYTLVWDDVGHSLLRVRNVEPASPIAAAGIHRGDVVLSIDGFTPQQVMDGALPAVTTAGVDRHFVVRDAAGTQRAVTVTSASFFLNPVAQATTFDAVRDGAPVKVGYLAYQQFAAYSVWNVALAMAGIAAQGANEMVLDLRYNTGGSVNNSRDLASMISGSQTDGAVYARLRANDKHPELNVDIPFMTAQTRFAQPLEGLQRVIVITSGSTASASEMLINGLRPFMQVVLIGDTTYGKPYGFFPRSDCGTTYNAVNFEGVNAQGQGGFSAGIPVDCPVADDLDHEMGDRQERRLKEALDYIATGRCSALGPQSATLVRKAPPRVFGETVPAQMFLEK